MIKIYKIIAITFFMLLLIIPMLRHIDKEDKKVNIENRPLAQKPVFPKSFKEFNKYTSLLDDYFSDQFGYRKIFIKKANEIRYYLFKEVTSKQITIGKQGFVFFNSHSAKNPDSLIKIVCDETPLTQTKQELILKTFPDFIEYFNKQGYKTAIAIIPTKSRIYPEMLPERESQWCINNAPTWLDENIKNIDAHSLYYPLEQMLNWKSEFQVYLPKHFHWNGMAPYRAAENMMRALWDIEPVFNLNPKKNVVITDLKRFLQGLNLKEESYWYDYKSKGVKECRGHCVENLNKVYKHERSFHFSKDNKTKRTLLLLTDSFGAAIAEHFIRGFDEVTMIDLNPLKKQEQTNFYKTILKIKTPSHLLLLIHDSGTYNRAVKFKNLLAEIKK